jgi:hypothetical protein
VDRTVFIVNLFYISINKMLGKVLRCSLTVPPLTGEKNLKVRMDDNFMLRYLRASDFSPTEAFEKV